MYSQDSKDKALGMLRLTGDVGKTARMSGVPGRTLRRWAAAAAKPRQRSRGAKFEPYGGEVRGKAMEMARGGASCREIAEALGIGSPDVVRYWLKGGGTKEARMGGRARTPEGDEPAYAGFEGGLEERIRQLELENDILRGAVDLLKAGSLGSMSNMEKTALIDKLRLESDRPLRELTDSLRISKSSYEYCRAKLRAKDRHAQLRADIRRIFDGAGGRRGYRYVHNELREGGVVVSEKVVRRLMAEEGCKVAYLKRRRRYNSYKGEISDAPPTWWGATSTRTRRTSCGSPTSPSSSCPARRRRTSARSSTATTASSWHGGSEGARTRRSPTAPWRTRAGRSPRASARSATRTGDAITDGPGGSAYARETA